MLSEDSIRAQQIQEEAQAVIQEIIARDMMLGDLSREAIECAADGRYMAGLACLFILMEQSVKLALGVSDGNFADLSKDALAKGLIEEEEHGILEKVRSIRNKLFHESHYEHCVVKDNLIWQFSEEETKEMLFKEYSFPCLKLAYKLCLREGVE